MAHFGQSFTCAQVRPKAGADCVGGFPLVESYHSDTSVVCAERDGEEEEKDQEEGKKGRIKAKEKEEERTWCLLSIAGGSCQL